MGGRRRCGAATIDGLSQSRAHAASRLPWRILTTSKDEKQRGHHKSTAVGPVPAGHSDRECVVGGWRADGVCAAHSRSRNRCSRCRKMRPFHDDGVEHQDVQGILGCSEAVGECAHASLLKAAGDSHEVLPMRLDSRGTDLARRQLLHAPELDSRAKAPESHSAQVTQSRAELEAKEPE